MYERYLAIRLHMKGRALTKITEILVIFFPTFSEYWNDYRKQGLQGLEFREYPGIWKLSDETRKDANARSQLTTNIKLFAVIDYETGYLEEEKFTATAF